MNQQTRINFDFDHKYLSLMATWTIWPFHHYYWYSKQHYISSCSHSMEKSWVNSVAKIWNGMENSNQTKSESSMAKLKIFKLIQENFKVVGFESSSVEQNYPFNRKIFMGFLTVSISFLWNLMTMLYEANTFVEYTQCIHMCSVSALIIFNIFLHFITIVFMWSLVTICGAFLMIQMQIVQYIYSNFFLPILVHEYFLFEFRWITVMI